MVITFLSTKKLIPNYEDYIKLIKSNIDKVQYYLIMNEINNNINHDIICVYNNDELIGTGTILIENKLIRGGSKVCHIEDIIIKEEYRGKGIGKQLIEHLKGFSKDCYKIILYCSNHNIEFYEKLGFSLKDNCMLLYK